MVKSANFFTVQPAVNFISIMRCKSCLNLSLATLNKTSQGYKSLLINNVSWRLLWTSTDYGIKLWRRVIYVTN